MTHGEDTVTELFAERLRDDLGLDAYAPFSGTVFDLAAGDLLYEAHGIRAEKKAVSTPKAQKAAAAFRKLLAIGERLLSVIRKNQGAPNKDLDKFAREIQSLCDKWDRDEEE